MILTELVLPVREGPVFPTSYVVYWIVWQRNERSHWMNRSQNPRYRDYEV